MWVEFVVDSRPCSAPLNELRELFGASRVNKITFTFNKLSGHKFFIVWPVNGSHF